jgi:CelD/BcsL family acetyltransferase involved in cellulose biosynthesis
MNFTTEYILCQADLDTQAPAWNELVDNGVTRHPYLRFEWFLAWWEAFGANRELFIVVIKEDTRWVAVAPLCITRRPFGPFRPRTLEFIYSHIGPRCEFILRENNPEVISRLLDAIIYGPRQWSVGCLELISEDSPTYLELRQLLDARCLHFDIIEGRGSPYLTITGSWEDYFAGLKKTRRQELRRSCREVAKLGTNVSYRHLTHRDDLMGYLPSLFDISARSWKKDTHTDMGSTKSSRKFYSKLTDHLSRANKLTAWALEVDGLPLAMMYCLTDGDRVIEMRFDFDDEYRRVAPGNALMGHILKHSFENKGKEHDFAGAAYSYKMAFANGVRRHFIFELYAPAIWPKMLYWLRAGWRCIRDAKKMIEKGD